MKNKSKIISAIVSLLILGLLVMLGPAHAFILSFSVVDDSVELGESLEFQVSAEVESVNDINITNFTLMFLGPENLTCAFRSNGIIIQGCDGIEIEQIESPIFGYSYGYGYQASGFFKYNITLDSSSLLAGDYIAKLTAFLENGELKMSEIAITILPAPFIVDKCSIRAKDGRISFQNMTFTNRNKLNLYFPVRKDGNTGKGELLSQDEKNRLSFKFDVKKAFRLSSSLIRFDVSGEIKPKFGPRITERAVIVFNEDTNKININGGTFIGRDMKVNFVKGCDGM